MRLKPFLLLSALLAASAASAQVSFTGLYTQNFDTLATSGTTNAWTDNVTLPGWYAKTVNTGTVTNYIANAGTTTNGSLYSFGTATDRALGSIASGTTGALRYGVALTNSTGATINSIALAYTGEEWRNGGNTDVQTLGLDYAVGATAIDGTNYTLNALNFNSPTVGATATALDGNAAANRTALSTTLNNLGWGAGQTLWIRFFDPNDAGNDHGLAVDDFSVRANVQATPEPSAFAALGVGALALLRRRRKA